MLTKKKILIVLSIVSIAAVSLIVLEVQKNKKPPTETSIPLTNGVKYGSLQPGVSSLSDVTTTMGNAISETNKDGSTILDYKSKNPNFNNELTIQSDKLTFVRQIVTLDENINIAELNQKYGDYKDVLYGPLSINGFDLYVYPDKGFAYIGNQQANIVLEMWYFPPTTVDDFKIKYAPDYSDTAPPPIQ